MRDKRSPQFRLDAALTASRACAVDLRRASGTPREWAQQLRPDIAIAAFSLPYLLNEQIE